jgi:hypothetical protein
VQSRRRPVPPATAGATSTGTSPPAQGGQTPTSSPAPAPDCVPAGSPHRLGRQAALRLRQQQCQQAACQLFDELQGLQQCEVKAVASSGSYWCNLWACGDVEQLAVGDNRVGRQALALPLVGG